MLKLEEIAVGEFNLELTLRCGQVFHWQKLGPGYTGVIDRVPVYVEQRGDRLLVTAGTAAAVSRYLALDHPLETIYATFPSDPVMQAALQSCRGLRIIRQPLWECLATFITSALKQVAHIAQISHTLRARFGGLVGEIGPRAMYAYPDIARVAALPEADLRACGLGFRAKSLLTTAQQLHQGGGDGVLELWRKLSRAETEAALTGFRGVGTKVANCVLLFGYEHLDAFPIDVWIERVLREKYFPGRPEATLVELQRFSGGYFGPYGGYAQQYLFHQARVRVGKKPTGGGARDEIEGRMRRVRRAAKRSGQK